MAVLIKSKFGNTTKKIGHPWRRPAENKGFPAGRSGCIGLSKHQFWSLHLSCEASAAPCRMSCSLCCLSAGCAANIRAASRAGRPNHTLEAGLIGLTYSIKPSIKPPLNVRRALTASDTADGADAAFSFKRYERRSTLVSSTRDISRTPTFKICFVFNDSGHLD